MDVIITALNEALGEQMSKEREMVKNSSWIEACIFEGLGNPTHYVKVLPLIHFWVIFYDV
jgi:hypothetical protein